MFSASQEVGPDGGIIEAYGLYLEIPEGALAETTEIEVTLLDRRPLLPDGDLDSAFAIGSWFAVAPYDLEFAAPVYVEAETGFVDAIVRLDHEDDAYFEAVDGATLGVEIVDFEITRLGIYGGVELD